MGTLKLVAKIVAGTAAFTVYVWFGAVHNLARAKRRKALRRARGRVTRTRG